MSEHQMKKWYRSKTLWACVLGLMTSATGMYVEGAEPWSIVLAVMSGLHGLLRVLTKEGVVL